LLLLAIARLLTSSQREAGPIHPSSQADHHGEATSLGKAKTTPPTKSETVNHRNAMVRSAHILNPAIETQIQVAEMAIQRALILIHARQG
jgi:hypothetical protein